MDELEDLSFIGNGAERAVYQTHAAGNALIIIDLCVAMLVRADGVHTAGFGAGALHFQNGPVRTDIFAAAALDTFFLINHGFAVFKPDGLFRANLHAGMRQTALAHIRNMKGFFRTFIAGKFDDVYQRRIIVFIGNGAFHNALGNGGVLIDRAQGQADGKAQAFADDGALQKDALAMHGHFARHDFIRQLLNAAVIAALIGKAGNFGKNFAANIRHGRIDSSHGNTPYIIIILRLL